MLTTNEVAEQLKVSTKTVQNWIKSGQLTAYKFGKDYRINSEDLQKFITNSVVNGNDPDTNKSNN